MGLASRWRVEEAGVSFTVCACVCVCKSMGGGGGGGRVWVCSTFEREMGFFSRTLFLLVLVLLAYS